MTESIGERIKTLRIGQGMTLAELGEKTDLSTSYLSQIERDKTSPSLTTLEAIAKALNIGLRYLFESGDDVPHVMRANKRGNTQGLKNSIERQPLMPQIGNPEIEVFRLTFQPCSPPEQIECFSGEEIIFVLEGELTISIGDEQFVLSAGDSIHFDALLAHSWKNDSDATSTIIWGRARALSDYQASSVTRVWNKIPEEDGI